MKELKREEHVKEDRKKVMRRTEGKREEVDDMEAIIAVLQFLIFTQV